ncbi:L,D-transpeptidase family protein [Caulobacter endophyticus]|uniref:L,D-transpeptidase family protein n=1 Tax=Caulobacter endophyticus TaxID=2172652 RepID=UPI00240F5AA6|nr:L,D-transpeptidase family protein [Caulobacter endophyticus]MDG2530809.1 L,D-transpeptidase family protein [Caulobacter endophyticus]
MAGPISRLAAPAVLLLAGCGAAAQPPAVEGSVDRIVIEKAAHRMSLYAGDRLVRTYDVSLGGGGLAPKTRQGDRRTPEGDYRITGRNPNSRFHLSLRISYPTPAQAAAARAQGGDPGGDIMIHGLPNGRGALWALYKGRDWTDGCIAVTDPEIEEVWKLVRDGARVRITP